MTGSISVGIAAAAGTAVAETLAPALERDGFHALWVNDTPGADALDVLAAAGRLTERLVLAVGVMPVDRRSPEDILARIDALRLPAERLVLGIGAGSTKSGALDRVREAAATLQSSTAARVVIGALGPRMRRLGADASQGLLLSWLTPELAAEQSAAAHASDPDAHVALYVRTAMDAAAVPRLREEAARYSTYPAYAAHFARLGISADETLIDPTDGRGRLEDYRSAVDEVVLRAITAGDAPEDYLRFVRRLTA